MSSLHLDWCSHEAAKYAVEHWHYSRCVPNQKTVKLGVWEDGRFVGVVLFGDGANPGMFQPYGLDYTQGCELVRIALRDHLSPVTQMVSVALRFLKRRCPHLRLVVSFADPEQGHHGGIYQAGNWVYAGMTEPADEYIVKGVQMHGRALRSTRSTHPRRRVPAANVLDWARKVIDPRASRVSGSGKHRYLLPLDDEIRRRILTLCQPYPKRAQSVNSGTPVHQTGSGGANPTCALEVA